MVIAYGNAKADKKINTQNAKEKMATNNKKPAVNIVSINNSLQFYAKFS